MNDSDPNRAGRFEPYREPSKWKTLGFLILLMAGLIGMLVFLLKS